MSNDETKQVTLTNLLTAIASSVAHGRQATDQEVARVARLYQRNDYLRGMSVPRIRLQKVTIDLPFVCLNVVESRPCKVSRPEAITGAVLDAARWIDRNSSSVLNQIERDQSLGSLETGGLTDEAYAILKKIFDRTDDASIFGFTSILNQFYEQCLNGLIDEQRAANVPDAAIQEKVGEMTEALVRSQVINMVVSAMTADDAPQPPQAVDNAAPESDRIRSPEEMGTRISRVTQMVLESQTVNDIVFQLRVAAENAAIETPATTPDLAVEVATEMVKTYAGAGATARLGLVLTEEGLEWASDSGQAGTRNWQLVPE